MSTVGVYVTFDREPEVVMTSGDISMASMLLLNLQRKPTSRGLASSSQVMLTVSPLATP